MIVERVRSLWERDSRDGITSFRVFYDSHYGPVLAIAYALSGSWPAAEEAAQEAFLRAFREWDRVSGFDRPDSWVRTVAANLARSRLRRLAAELRAVTRLSSRTSDRYEDAQLPAMSQQVWAAVRSLPRRQAEVVVLHYLEDASVDDVATTLGIAAGTVKAHLHHARKNLAKKLDTVEGDR
jgi:RNA polymerase sigma-70 factor (ECF subfamily)